MELLLYPDPRLRDIATPLKAIDDEVKAVIEEMFDIMRRQKGVGLAGTQVGYARRAIVANLTGKAEDDEVFLNPEIVKKDGEVREEEGCLSFPGMTVTIARAETVWVEYTNLDGKRRRVEATGLAAKMFQHEIDHLDGVLMIDRMGPADRLANAKRLKELDDDFRAARKTVAAERGHGVSL